MRVLVVCARRYNGHELWVALRVMQKGGHEFEVVSTDTLIEDEVTHKKNRIKRTVYSVSPEEALDSFGALMIVSGNMADTEAYWDDGHVLSLVRAFGEADRPIAAICCSVPTVAEVAKGKTVSFFPLIRSRQRLKAAGAILSNVTVSVDGKLATAEHQMATETWAGAFVRIMNGESVTLGLVDSGFVPMGNERMPIKVLEQQKRNRQKVKRNTTK